MLSVSLSLPATCLYTQLYFKRTNTQSFVTYRKKKKVFKITIKIVVKKCNVNAKMQR